jgi:ribonucleotide reductase alpha subunit
MTETKEFVEEKQKEQIPPTLSVQDLAQVVQVIDAAFTRGAFRASEASDVGKIYEKISNFVNYTVESQKAQEDKKEQ